MPGQVLETSLIRPLSEFSLVFGFVAFSDFNFVYFFSFFSYIFCFSLLVFLFSK